MRSSSSFAVKWDVGLLVLVDARHGGLVGGIPAGQPVQDLEAAG